MIEMSVSDYDIPNRTLLIVTRRHRKAARVDRDRIIDDEASQMLAQRSTGALECTWQKLDSHSLSGTSLCPPSVAFVRRPGYPRRFFGREKIYQVGDLFWLSGPSDGMCVFCVLQKLGVVRFIHPAPLVQVGHNDTGIDSIDANALWCELERSTTRQLIRRRF